MDFAAPNAVDTLAENTESCFSSLVLLHDGHSTLVPLRTSVSKQLLHSPQMYSNIGIAIPFSQIAGQGFSQFPELSRPAAPYPYFFAPFAPLR